MNQPNFKNMHEQKRKEIKKKKRVFSVFGTYPKNCNHIMIR